MNQCDLCKEWFDGDGHICPACEEAIVSDPHREWVKADFDEHYYEDEEDYEHPF